MIPLSQPQQTTASALTGAFFYQPKLNGVRCYLDNGELKTRNGRFITCLPHIINEIKENHLSHIPLDGELYIHNYDFHKLNGLVRRKKHIDEHLKIKLHVFDIIDDIATQEQRLAELQTLPALKTIKIIPTISSGSAEVAYNKALELNFEGLIARDKNTSYGAGVYKIKPVFDKEYRITRVYNGGLECITRNNKTFKIKTTLHGLQVNDLVTIEYSALTPDNIPFHGRVKSNRHDLPDQEDEQIEDNEDIKEPNPPNDVPVKVFCFMVNCLIACVVCFFTVLFSITKK